MRAALPNLADETVSATFSGVILYYITDRTQFPGDELSRQAALLARIAEAVRWGVDYIQLREKNLSTHDLETLSRKAATEVRKNGNNTKFIINSRCDVAMAAGADGVHLRSQGDLAASDARVIFTDGGKHHPIIACSCHTLEEVALAESHGADLAVFAPVFEKNRLATAGLETLRAACKREVAASSRMPVLALGGITLENAAECIKAGAAGVAGIRLFQSGDIGNTVSALRRLGGEANSAFRRRHPYQSEQKL